MVTEFTSEVQNPLSGRPGNGREGRRGKSFGQGNGETDQGARGGIRLALIKKKGLTNQDEGSGIRIKDQESG